jgi:DNA polymerase I
MTEKTEARQSDCDFQRTSNWTTNRSNACELATGGFTAKTEVLTTTSLTKISDLSPGEVVYALDPVSRLIKPKPVTAVEPVLAEGELIAIETRRADIRVAPGHRIPYRTEARDEIRFKRAGDLAEQSYYKFVNDWRSLPKEPFGEVDLTDFVEEYEACVSHNGHGHTFRAALPENCEPVRNNGHTGYHFDARTFKQFQTSLETIANEITIRTGPNHHRRPYRFDGDDFIEFLGWFITEGNVYWPTSSDTAQIKIAQENESHRNSLTALFDRLGIGVHRDDRKFEFGSKVFGELLEDLCGAGSRNKHLPGFVWSLPADQQQLLLDVLLAGDGNDRQTYYTSSDHLMSDVLRLCLELGIKPRYTSRRGIWQIYVREVKDGFQSAEHVQRIETDSKLYRLTVADYSVIMAGRNGKFQWTGVSNVS